MTHELTIIGLPGAHNHGGLAAGNLHSITNDGSASNPKAAALQAIDLAESVIQTGRPVAFMPPQMRPDINDLVRILADNNPDLIETLETLVKEQDSYGIIAFAAGEHTNSPIDEEKRAENVRALKQMYSSAAMWVANAATVTQSIDTTDGKTHLTPANLHQFLHRRVEQEQTTHFLREFFKDIPEVVVHDALDGELYPDEGAANHIRLAPSHDDKGLHVFIYGKDPTDPNKPVPKQVARQTLATSKEIARAHGIPEEQCLFLQQNPEAINSDVFHNDVISIGNGNVLFYHEKAFLDGDDAIKMIAEKYRALHGTDPVFVPVSSEELSLNDVAQSYLFNSQLVTLPNGDMKIIAHTENEPAPLNDNPTDQERAEHEKAMNRYQAVQNAKTVIDRVTSGNFPIRHAEYKDLTQSMRNGGGPACLRLRVPLEDTQIKALDQNNRLMSVARLNALRTLIKETYPEKIEPEDLSKPWLYDWAVERTSAMDDFFSLNTWGYTHDDEPEHGTRLTAKPSQALKHPNI